MLGEADCRAYPGREDSSSGVECFLALTVRRLVLAPVLALEVVLVQAAVVAGDPGSERARSDEDPVAVKAWALQSGSGQVAGLRRRVSRLHPT